MFKLRWWESHLNQRVSNHKRRWVETDYLGYMSDALWHRRHYGGVYVREVIRDASKD